MSDIEKRDKQVGELTTFYEMLASLERGKRFDKILIPKIQRDYAQGRTGREMMRSRFLNRLFGAIDEKEESEGIELDFIYGQKNGSEFLPIDGQQRLTTLFLLHLYVGKRCKENVDILQGFTYDTRDSSKEFCLKLIEIPEENFRGIKGYIENQWWYTRRWSNDPTISSMVVMLNDIDNHYKDVDDARMATVWQNLVHNDKIKYWKLTLDDLKTTDDLYIKMNSRGKSLTNFEHFKAEIESYIHDSKAKDAKIKAGKFSLKIDTSWTNLLWKYRNKEADNNIKEYGNNGLDNMFVNIFKRFMLIEGAKEGRDFKKLESEHILKLSELILKQNPDLLDKLTVIMDFFVSMDDANAFFKEILTLRSDENRIKDNVAVSSDKYRVYLQQQLYGSEDFLYRAAIWDNMTIANLLMLEAFFHYASLVKVVGNADIATLREKMRIIRNLILNSRDELRAERVGALLNRVDAIIEKNALDAEASGEFRQAQVVQEIQKIHFMNEHPHEAWNIKFAENHSVLCGNLSCYMDGGSILVSLLMKHEQLFHADADYDKIERFLLTFGDYAPTVNERKLYGGRSSEHWRDDIFNNGNKVSIPILYEALNYFSAYDESVMDNRIQEWIGSCIEKSKFPWRYYLVAHRGTRHGDWARYAKSNGFVSYGYIMMNKNNFNGKHWNPYLYCLFAKMTGKYKVKLGDYNDPLIFETEEIAVMANESDFELVFNDGSKQTINVHQDEEGIDTADRINMAEKELIAVLEKMKLQ